MADTHSTHMLWCCWGFLPDMNLSAGWTENRVFLHTCQREGSGFNRKLNILRPPRHGGKWNTSVRAACYHVGEHQAGWYWCLAELVGGWGGGVSVHAQVSSITWVQHVSLTSRTYICNPGLMIFSPNLASFHSKPLWSAICILVPTGWKLCEWDFLLLLLLLCLTPFFFCIFSLNHSLYLGLVNSSLRQPPHPPTPSRPALWLSGSPFNISYAPRTKQTNYLTAGFNLTSPPACDPSQCLLTLAAVEKKKRGRECHTSIFERNSSLSHRCVNLIYLLLTWFDIKIFVWSTTGYALGFQRQMCTLIFIL